MKSTPKSAIDQRFPRGWRHFLAGGDTAVNVPETNWFLVNKTREFVVEGGVKMPRGSVVFRVGDHGEQIPLWTY